jgi:hypothetical protein
MARRTCTGAQHRTRRIDDERRLKRSPRALTSVAHTMADDGTVLA